MWYTENKGQPLLLFLSVCVCVVIHLNSTSRLRLAEKQRCLHLQWTSMSGFYLSPSPVWANMPGFYLSSSSVWNSIPGFLHVVLGIDLRSLCLKGKHCPDWAVSCVLLIRLYISMMGVIQSFLNTGSLLWLKVVIIVWEIKMKSRQWLFTSSYLKILVLGLEKCALIQFMYY